MKITYSQYAYYLDELKKANERISRDKKIIKHIQKIKRTKDLTPSDETKLFSLIVLTP